MKQTFGIPSTNREIVNRFCKEIMQECAAVDLSGFYYNGIWLNNAQSLQQAVVLMFSTNKTPLLYVSNVPSSVQSANQRVFIRCTVSTGDNDENTFNLNLQMGGRNVIQIFGQPDIRLSAYKAFGYVSSKAAIAATPAAEFIRDLAHYCTPTVVKRLSKYLAVTTQRAFGYAPNSHTVRESIKLINDISKKRIRAIVKEAINQLQMLNESTRAEIGMIYPDGKIKVVYLHNDGDPSDAGQKLRKYWTNPNDVRELIANGGISVLGKQIGTKHDFDDRAHNDDTTFYVRDRGEGMANNAPDTYNHIYDYVDKYEDSDADYFYLYDTKTRQWKYAANTWGHKMLDWKKL